MASPPFDPNRTEEERTQRASRVAAMQEGYGQKDYLTAKARATQAPSTVELAKQAIEEARKVLPPDAPKELVAKQARYVFDKLKTNYDKQTSAERTALSEAEAEGAGIRSKDVRPDDGSLPSKDTGVLHFIGKQLTRGSRAASGALAGAVEEAQNITKDVPITEGTFHESKLGFSLPSKDEIMRVLALGGNAMAGGGFAPSLAGGGPSAAEAAAILKASQDERTKPKDWVPFEVGETDINPLRKVVLAGGNPRAFGVPLASLDKAILQDPSKLLDIAKHAGRSAAEGFMADTPRVSSDLENVLDNKKRDYVSKAVQQAKSELVGGTKEQIAARAKALYNDALSSDLATVRHSTLAQTGTEMALDPLNFVPVGKIAGAAWGAAKEAPVVGPAIQKGLELTDKLTAGFRHMPVLDPMRRAGGEMRDASKLSELAQAESDRISNIVSRMKSTHLKEIAKVTDPVEKELLYNTASGLSPIEKLPEHLLPAYKASQQLEASHRALRNVTGIGNTVDAEGVLTAPNLVAEGSYVPHRVVREGMEDTAVGIGGRGRSTMTPGSSRERTIRPEDAQNIFEPDVYKQWDAELKSTERLGKAAYEVKRTRQYLRDSGALVEVHAPVVEDTEAAANSIRQATQIKETTAQLQQSAAQAKKIAEDLETKVSWAKHDAMLNTGKRSPEDAAKIARIEVKAAAARKEAQALEQQFNASVEQAPALLQEARGAQATLARSKQAAVELQAKKAELSKTTGVPWVELQSDLQNVVSKLTGKPGATISGAMTIVPAPIAERFKQLVPVLLKTNTPVEEAITALGAVNNYLIRPMQKVWRVGKTIPSPVFHVKNFIGAFSMSTVAHGAAAFNPRLQGAALHTALLAAGLGSQKALATRYVLNGGAVTTYADILKVAERTGVINQFDLRMGYEMSGKGILGKGADLVQKVTKFDLPVLREIAEVSPEAVARATDNYQHLVAFIGFLDEMSPKGLAKALELTSKFAGNYKRLGSVEKAFFKETFSFYAWSRFILPLTISQLIEHPERLSKWVLVKQGFERAYGPQSPVTKWGVPRGFGSQGFTAPPSAQPETLRRYTKDGKLPPLGSHEFAMMVVEDPMTVGLSLIPALEATFGKGIVEGRDTLAQQLGPLTTLAAQIMGKQDIRTGDPIKEVFPFPEAGESPKQWMQRLRASSTGQFISGFGGELEPWVNLYKLYAHEAGKPRDAIDLQLRYVAGRASMGLDNWIAELMGQEGLSLGGMFSGGIPGGTTMLVNPMREAMQKKETAVKSLKDRQRALNQPSMFDPLMFGGK